MSGTLKVGGKTLATHDTNTNVAKIQLGSTSDVVITDSAGNNVLSESGGVVTLTADTAVIEGSSSGNLVRITQTGSGNALVVEDSANPDSTPFVVTNDGNLLVGTQIALFSSNTFLVNSAKNALVLKNDATADSTTLLNCIKSGATSSTSQRYIEFSYNGGANGNGGIAGNGDSQATFISLSDERLKENIEDLPTQIGNIMALRPVEFDYKATGGHQIGFIAQEVQGIYPDLVAEDDDGYLTLAGFDKNTARLIKVIQEQQTLIESQQSQIDALTARIEALEATP